MHCLSSTLSGAAQSIVHQKYARSGHLLEHLLQLCTDSKLLFKQGFQSNPSGETKQNKQIDKACLKIERYRPNRRVVLPGSHNMGALAMVVAVAASIAAAAFYSHIISTSGIRDPVPLNWPRPPKKADYPPRFDALERMERIGEGELPGPEDMAVDAEGKYMYAACKDGWIRRICLKDGRVEKWTYVGGRPLGIVAGLGDGEMLVCEPEQGLLNVTEGKVQVLSSEADGLKYKLADGVDVAKDGTIYFTDASTKFNLHDFHLDLVEGRPYGRLLKYSPETRETTVLLKDLYFVNGVALSETEDFIVFCETSHVRLQRYWLRGEQKGTAEIFIDNLPGLPDNVHRSGNKFWISLLGGRSVFGERALRFSFVQHLFGSRKMVLHYLSNSYARVLAVSEDGHPLELYESLQSKSIGFMTTGMQVGDSLYLGSLISDYIGKISLTNE